MGTTRWSWPSLALAVLLVAGAAGYVGAAVTAGRYAAVATALGRFELAVTGVTAGPALGPPLRVELACRNAGPMAVELLELQALAWHNGRYVGAGSRDLRNAPLRVMPGDRAPVWVVVQPSTTIPPGSGGTWRFSLSGRVQLPRVGARVVRADVTFP